MPGDFRCRADYSRQHFPNSVTRTVIKRLFSVARLVLAWYLLFLALYVVADWFWWPLGDAVTLVGLVTIVFVVIRAYSHLGRVQLIDGKPSAAAALSNRQIR